MQGQQNAIIPKKDFFEWVKDKVSEDMGMSGNVTQNHETVGEEVHTEMTVTPYFQGELAEARHYDYHPDPHSTRREELPIGWRMPPYSFFIEHEHKTPSSVCLVGEAGSGKTTAMRRYIAQCPNDFHFVLCSPFTRREIWAESTIFDFLFPDKSRCTVDVLEDGFQWMLQNPQSITFHLDALDTLPFVREFDREISDHIVSDETLDLESYHTPKEIIGAIMSGCLFRGCRLVFSSRHSAVTKLPERFRPKRMISLVGLSDDSVEKYTISDLGDADGKEFCRQIKMKHPNLWLMLAIPLFLVFSLISYQRLKHLPSSMSDVLVSLLCSLQHSKHGKSMQKVVTKMKKMSYDGILENKVAFNNDDLNNAGITMEQATSLSICVPWKKYNLPGTERMRNLLFFSHLCIQEIFCALYVIEMEFQGFMDFLNEHFKNIRLSVVRRFIVGILLNERVLENAKAGKLISDLTDLQKKKEALLKFLKEELNRDKDSQETLDIFVTACEAGEDAKDAVEEGLQSIDISGISTACRPSDMHAIGSTIKYCSNLGELDISNCDLNPEKMEAFYSGLMSAPRGGKVKIQKFRLKRSTNLGVRGLRFLAKSLEVLVPEKLTLDRSKISAEQLQALKEELDAKSLKINKLHLKEIFDAGVEMTDDKLSAICQLLPHLHDKISIRGWRLNDEQCAVIKDELKQNPAVLVKYGDKNVSNALTAERIEDVIAELIDKHRVNEMREFATRRQGLKLTDVECDDVRKNFQNDAKGERKGYLECWYKKLKPGKKETAACDLRKIADEYFNPPDEGVDFDESDDLSETD